MPRPSTREFRRLLSRCKILRHLLQIHAQAITLGLLSSSQPLSCAILGAYARLHPDSDEALCAFQQIPSPDLVSRTAVMWACLRARRPQKAISVFRQTLVDGLRPDAFSLVGAISAASHVARSWKLGKAIHGMACRLHLAGEVFVGNSLIHMYCRSGRFESAQEVFDGMPCRDAVTWSTVLHGSVMCQGLDLARQLFDKMPQRNIGCWTVMITGYAQGGQPVRALELFYRMKLDRHQPTPITFVSVLSACADTGALVFGRSVHGHICKVCSNPSLSLLNALMDMYAKSGRVDVTYEIFGSIENKDVYTWTTMISGLAVHGRGRETVQLFVDMLSSGVTPNEITFLSVLLACSHSGMLQEGWHWFRVMHETYNCEQRMEHYGCMVDLLSRAGLVEEADKFIAEMGIEPDIAIWRSMLSACLFQGDLARAEVFARRVLELEPDDDDAVYVLLWNMYAHAEKWELVLEMKEMMRGRKMMKQPGYSWIEVNGIVHAFLVEDAMHSLWSKLYEALNGLERQLKDSFTVG